MFRFNVLGPLEVFRGERLIHIRAKKRRVLLAALLAEPGRGVSTRRLISLMWDEEKTPGNARGALQIHVNRLRRLLSSENPRGGDLIRTLPDGYAIDVDAETLDLLHFERLEQRLRDQRGRVHESVEMETVTAALGLWRGPALCDIPSDALHRATAHQLNERRLALLEHRFELGLRLGQHAEIVAEVQCTVTAYPLRERLWSQLIHALIESGRKAEALDAYRLLARTLADEVGVDPSDELKRLHHRILTNAYVSPYRLARDSPPGARPPAPGDTTAVTAAIPSWPRLCQLPPALTDFVGRDGELGELRAVLDGSAAGTGLPVVAVTGPAGAGKTALTVQAAHELRFCYPDGQWFVRLGGAGDRARTPYEVLAEMLRSSGVPPAAIPATLDARAALFRARIADRRVLLLLDDARGAEQILPLLPGTSSCTVLVTSRRNLSDLLAQRGARLIALSVLTPEESQALLARVLGDQGGHAATAHETAELARLCAYLPLALRVATASLLTRPWLSLSAYLDELRDGDRPFGERVTQERRKNPDSSVWHGR